MGTIESLLGNRVYLDANVLIYALEGVQPYAPLLEEILSLIPQSKLAAATSELSLAELIVKPIELGNSAA